MAKRLVYHNDGKSISFSSFLCKDGVILYKIVRKNNSYWHLEYNEKNKYFLVICPKNASYSDVELFVKYKYKHIMYELQEVDENKPWMLFGQALPVEIIMGNEFKYQFLGDKIIIYLKNKSDYKYIARKFYKEIGRAYMMPRLQELLQSLGLKACFGKCFVSWLYLGWCFYSEKMINMNAFLMQHSKEVIDEVLYHEIAHLTVPNHSKEFWKLHESYCPNYKEINKQYSKMIFDHTLGTKIWI